MKVLASADWHLKLGAKNIPESWAINRYRLLFDKLHDLEAEVDLHIIMGDIFDRMPSIKELELYFEFIEKCNVETIIIPGNHEALTKHTTFLTNLKNVTSSINRNVRIIDDYYTYKGIDFIPYNRLKEVWPETLTSPILVSHCRGEILPHVKAEIPLELFDRWGLVLAGDLHSYANSQRNILYPGSPVTTSFHRGFVDTGVIILDTDTLNHTWEKMALPQLIRRTISAGEAMTPSEYHHTIYEIEGDMSELSDVEHSELLDKKVVKRSTDTTLILDPSMTLLDEVEEYARYVLELNDAAIDSMLEVLNQHIGELKE